MDSGWMWVMLPLFWILLEMTSSAFMASWKGAQMG
jgi:hypothetical protein